MRGGGCPLCERISAQRRKDTKEKNEFYDKKNIPYGFKHVDNVLLQRTARGQKPLFNQ